VSSWELTTGLQHLRNQVNYFFPGRDKTSDGTIGDAAHQAETSGHNPDDTSGSKPEWNGDPDNDPEVRAWDMDNNLQPGFDCQVFVDHIVGLKPSSVLRYVIYNRKIYKAENGWRAEAYTGPSPHTEHVHFSGAYSQAADNNNVYDYRLEEIPVAMTPADKSWIAGQVNEIVGNYFDKREQPDGTPTSTVGDAVLTQGIPNGTKEGAPRDQAWKVIQDLGTANVALQKKVDTLTATVQALAAQSPTKA
jgi:hypothetical protein